MPKRPRKFDPEGTGYDYDTAVKGGGVPDAKTGHWGSLDPSTGMVLKGRKHPTWGLMVQEEGRMGHEIIKEKDGRYYARKRR